MKTTLKIKSSDYRSNNHSKFADKFVEIIQAILANTLVFLSIPITQAALEDAAAAIIEKTNKAKKGSETDKDGREIQAAVCLGYLNILASYVLQVANQKLTLEQQIEVVNLSKFTLAKIDHVPAPPLPQVTGISGKWTGIAGEADVEWNRIETGVVVYNVFKTFTNPFESAATWQFAGSTPRKKMTLDGLPGISSQVWVQVVAIGKDGETSVPSDPALITIQF